MNEAWCWYRCVITSQYALPLSYAPHPDSLPCPCHHKILRISRRTALFFLYRKITRGSLVLSRLSYLSSSHFSSFPRNAAHTWDSHEKATREIVRRGRYGVRLRVWKRNAFAYARWKARVFLRSGEISRRNERRKINVASGRDSCFSRRCFESAM